MTVFLIAAITVDGFIAQDPSQISTAWTSSEDKQWFNQRTKEAGVIVMGSKTYDTIGRALPKRLNIVMSRGAQAQTIPTANEREETQLLYTNLTPIELITDLKNKNYSEIAICGGSSIYSEFLKAGLIDKIYLTLEPIVFGKGVGLFNQDLLTNLELQNVTKMSTQTLLLEYGVKNKT